MKRLCAVTCLFVALLGCPTWARAHEGASGKQAAVPAEPPPFTIEPAMPDNDSRACPQTRYIVCMPTLEKEARPMCSPEYLRWLKKNCPEVEVVF